ncbi:MAG: undecaprenyl-diphosphate phosphatase [Acidobacteriota bacterium]
MTVWQAALLGVVQGVTEFLPVSSSGHLALAQRLLPGFQQPGLVFDVALHLGTVASVLALEWRRLADAVREGRTFLLGAQLALATAVTAVVALPLRHTAEAAFAEPLAVAAGFAATGIVLLLAGAHGGTSGPGSTRWGTVAAVGLAQGFAVMPGLSRSGSTIATGLAVGLERRWAVDFSFLMSVPAVLGAAVVEGWSYRHEISGQAAALAVPSLVGAVVAGVVGAAAITGVRRIVHRGGLHFFAYYVLALAALTVGLRLAGRL